MLSQERAKAACCSRRTTVASGQNELSLSEHTQETIHAFCANWNSALEVYSVFQSVDLLNVSFVCFILKDY